MAVDLESVPQWWTLDGVGHVLYSACTCGECDDARAALCGLHAPALGDVGDAVPPRVCSACRRALSRPTLKLGDPRVVRRPRPSIAIASSVEEVPDAIARAAADALGIRRRHGHN